MKSKPSWGFWLTCVVAYLALDLIISALWHGSFEWGHLREAIESSLFGATVTWLFALYKWHKADSGF